METWEEIYKNKKFEINTKEPSKIVKKIFKIKPKVERVLDLGCGNGRNAIYASKFSAKVDCVDIVNLEARKSNKKITFKKTKVTKFEYGKNKYDIILIIRLIQYLSSKELRKTLKRSSKALKPKGLIAISYTKSGGIFKKDLKINKFSHSLKNLKKIFKENNLKIIKIHKGNKYTSHVSYKIPVKTYQIILTKLK